MIPAALKTYFMILLALAPCCNGELLIYHSEDHEGLVESGQGGSGGTLNQGGSDSQGGFGGSSQMGGFGGSGGQGGMERTCFCQDLLDGKECDDSVANEKYGTFRDCGCALDQGDNQTCQVCDSHFCGKNIYELACDSCWTNDATCSQFWFKCISDK